MAKHNPNHPWVRRIDSDCAQATRSALARDGLDALSGEARFERERNANQNNIIRDMFRSGALKGQIINGGSYN